MSKQRKPISWKRRWRIYQKGNGRCHICGEPLDFLECSIDHVIPLSAGGSDDDDNLMPAHRTCNSRKNGIRKVRGEHPIKYSPKQDRFRAQLANFVGRQRVDGKHMTQAQFAARLGMHRLSVNRIFTGKQPITAEFVGKFVMAFGPEATTLIFGDDETPEVLPCSEATA